VIGFRSAAASSLAEYPIALTGAPITAAAIENVTSPVSTLDLVKNMLPPDFITSFLPGGSSALVCIRL
jgi:hypothetical protein